VVYPDADFRSSINEDNTNHQGFQSHKARIIYRFDTTLEQSTGDDRLNNRVNNHLHLRDIALAYSASLDLFT